MTELKQQDWLSKFSRGAFIMPGVFLLRARKVWLGILLILGIILIANVFGSLGTTVSIILSLIFRIWIGLKGRALGFKSTNKTFEVYKKQYKKANKVFILLTPLVIISFFILFTLLSVGLYFNKVG